jgi:hypothetical protein
VQALVSIVIANQICLQVQNGFNTNDAIGVQLDVIGKYAGVNRTAVFNSTTVALDDNDFRTLILFSIATTNSESSLSKIQEFLNLFFKNKIYVFDFSNMTMGYFIRSDVMSYNLAKFITTQNILPKPIGVAMTTTIFSSIIDSFFGFRTYGLAAYNSKPFNTYLTYDMFAPWLSYANSI